MFRVNSQRTEWFDVSCGFRQECILSPILFHLFINDLPVDLKSFKLCVQLDNAKVYILLYADEIVLFADSKEDLQILLINVNDWCYRNEMFINVNKSNIVQFQNLFPGNYVFLLVEIIS